MGGRGQTRHGRDVWAYGVAGSVLLRGLTRTFRVRRLGTEHVQPFMQEGRGFIYTFWHAQLLHLACLMQHSGATILVSEHRDGEIITQIIERMGYGTVRGSSTRGGYRALLEMSRLGRAGRPLGITPDGPRGPRHQVQPGAILVAHRAGVPMIPIAAYAHPEKRLQSWDRFQVPFPLSRVVVATGPPLPVPSSGKAEEAVATYGPRLAAAMGAITRAAAHELREWARLERDPDA